MRSVCIKCNCGIVSTDAMATDNPPTCSSCRLDLQQQSLLDLINELLHVKNLGHNNDCIFCGLKDKHIETVLTRLGIYTSENNGI